jgi:phosphatidylserine decarboxylase
MKKVFNSIIFGIIFLMISTLISAQTYLADKEGPCYKSIHALEEAYYNKEDTSFKELIDNAFANLQQPPEDYANNPWIGKQFSDLVVFLNKWATFLPVIHGSEDNGLMFIEEFLYFYYQNPYGVKFVQTSPGKEILQDFVKQRGAYMDSEESAAEVAGWLADDRIEKEDYNLPDSTAADGGFKSFNEFFARTLKDQEGSRPQTMPERDYVIAAPTDCIINSIPMKITDADTKIPTKGNQALNIIEMLDNSKYAEKFIGGTALSCILMPNTYHHYHSPVDGKVVEAKVIEDAYFGYDNFPYWIAHGNVGYKGTDFSQFENFQRGYFIIDTGKYGNVAVIPVGLNTISSIVFDERFKNLDDPVSVKRGDHLGHFLYGGSLVIIIFESDRYKSDAVRVRLGNQIGIFD